MLSELHFYKKQLTNVVSLLITANPGWSADHKYKKYILQLAIPAFCSFLYTTKETEPKKRRFFQMHFQILAGFGIRFFF